MSLTLPDASEAVLNADSRITYDKKDWKESRDLSLDGEAYFMVAKGSRFTIHTKQGDVSVLGTQFNVKVREDLFEVICYEGLVQVDYAGKSVRLPKSHTFKLHRGVVVSDRTEFNEPSWISKKSVFKSSPLAQVLQELERQHNITVKLSAEYRYTPSRVTSRYSALSST